MSVQGATIHPPSTSLSIHFRLEVESGFAEYFKEGAHVGTYPIDKHIFTILPESDFPRSLEETIQELLRQDYIPSIQNERLIWRHPAQHQVDEITLGLERAKEHTNLGNYGDAVVTLLEIHRLACGLPDKLGEAHFLEKINRAWLEELFRKTLNQEIELLLLKKDAVRMAFEIALEELSQLAKRIHPTCFVCFSLEEDIENWLEQTFVRDLKQTGIVPLFCCRHLCDGMDLNEFQQQIRTADLVAIICTRDLKEKFDNRKQAPIGVAQEIRLAQERYNDPDKNGTNFPIYLKGDHRTVCPSPLFEPILGRKFTFFERSTPTQLFSYYSGAFELFGSMLNIERDVSRRIKESFLVAVKKILRDKEIDREKVQQWLQREAKEPVQKTRHPELIVPHPNFVGRESLRKQLEKDFCLRNWTPRQVTQIRILCGPGGIGKTELAIKYANDHQSDFSFICVIHSELQQQQENDYRKLADSLGLSRRHLAFEDLRGRVHESLANWKNQKPWLLIYDNVEAAVEIPPRGGCVIVTSQYQNIWEDPNAFVRVPPFSLQEAGQLFRKLQKPIPEKEVKPLLDQVEGFPNLLEQAAHFLRRSHDSVDEYLQHIRDGRMLWEAGGKRHPKSMAEVFTRNLNILKQKNIDAYEFLQFCAYLNPDRISRNLVEFWCFEKKKNEPDRAKSQIIASLEDFHFIRYSEYSHTFSIHRSLQTVIQTVNKDAEYLSAVDILARWAKKFNCRDAKTENIAEECALHLETVKVHKDWEKVEGGYKMAFSFMIGSWYVRVRHDYVKAKKFL